MDQRPPTKVLMTETRPRNRPQSDDSNRRRIIWIVALFLISVEIPEIPTYIHYFKPSVYTHNCNWFWMPGFKRVQAEYWYYKDTATSLAWVVRMIAVCKIAVTYSITVFLAAILVLAYIVFDGLMYWLNLNEWPLTYEFFILFIYLVGRSLVSPYKPDAYARIRSLF